MLSYLKKIARTITTMMKIIATREIVMITAMSVVDSPVASSALTWTSLLWNTVRNKGCLCTTVKLLSIMQLAGRLINVRYQCSYKKWAIYSVICHIILCYVCVLGNIYIGCARVVDIHITTKARSYFVFVFLWYNTSRFWCELTSKILYHIHFGAQMQLTVVCLYFCRVWN